MGEGFGVDLVGKNRSIAVIRFPPSHIKKKAKKADLEMLVARPCRRKIQGDLLKNPSVGGRQRC